MSTDDASDTTINDLGGAEDMLSPMEATDSDELRNADGDEVVDPPDHWSGVEKVGMTAGEALIGESLDQRLAEEVPDVTPDDPGTHRGQVDGTTEDGDSLFPVVD